MTTETNPTTDLSAMLANLTAEQRLVLLQQIDARELKAAAEKVEKAKPTLQSLTFDAIVAAYGLPRGNKLTAVIAEDVTKAAREAGVIKADESAQQSSIAALLRYSDGFMAALSRAAWTVNPPVADAAPEGDKTPEGDNATPPADAPKQPRQRAA